MKKTLQIITTLLFIGYSLHAQWQKIYTSDSAALLYVHTFNADKAIVIGTENYLLQTSNGGVDWDSVYYGYSQQGSMRFLNDNTGFVVGSVPFPVGPTCFKTNDGGNSWQSMNLSFSALTGLKVCFLNNDTGFVCSGYGLNKTYNGGDTFMNKIVSPTGYNFLKDIVFVNNQIGFVATSYRENFSENVSANKIFRSIDQGESWQEVYSDNDMGNDNFAFTGIVKLFFVNEQNGFAVGGEGKILKTNDGGSTWQNVPNTLGHDITDIDFLQTDKGYIACGGKLYYTNDGMATWQLQSEEGDNIYFIDMLNDSVGYASGNGVFKTTNGGGISGLDNPVLENQFFVYPYPASSTLNLSYKKNMKVQSIVLMDMEGRKIKCYNKDTKRLDVSGIASGNYLLNICTDQGSLSKKVILQ